MKLGVRSLQPCVILSVLEHSLMLSYIGSFISAFTSNSYTKLQSDVSAYLVNYQFHRFLIKKLRNFCSTHS